jgi:DNA-3-methyladenine glycosylase
MLPLHFFTRPDPVQVAKDLLGKYLVTHFDGAITAGKIVETEAYRAPDDRACHAFGNRRTARTEVMFGAGGRAYIYLCYGIHHLFNVVTGPEGMAHAVLIRGIEPTDNVDFMLERRGMDKLHPRLTAGPGALTRALGIHTSQSGLSLLDPAGLFWLEDRGEVVLEENIIAGPRVGVAYAKECAAWPWRFRIKGSVWASPAR